MVKGGRWWLTMPENALTFKRKQSTETYTPRMIKETYRDKRKQWPAVVLRRSPESQKLKRRERGWQAVEVLLGLFLIAQPQQRDVAASYEQNRHHHKSLVSPLSNGSTFWQQDTDEQGWMVTGRPEERPVEKRREKERWSRGFSHVLMSQSTHLELIGFPESNTDPVLQIVGARLLLFTPIPVRSESRSKTINSLLAVLTNIYPVWSTYCPSI
ncbi:hypothetical protein LXL04_003834 [Taraxacum kok-saghyz]